MRLFKKAKTIKELNEKMWYRILKVVYVFIYIIALGASIIGFFVGIYEIINDYRWAWDTFWASVGGIVATPIVAEVIKRTFYYIYFGALRPDKTQNNNNKRENDKCKKCGVENSVEAKFCEECGNQLIKS